MKKIMFVGQVNTGKTTITTHFLKNRQLVHTHYPTMGVEAGIKVLKYPNEQFGLVQFWDTAGKHQYHKDIAERYYEDTTGFLIMIDKTNENSLKSINYWLSRIKSLMRGKDYIIGVLATKIDLQPEFTTQDYNKMYRNESDIVMYEELNLKDDRQIDGYTSTETAIRNFVKRMYKNTLLKVLPEYHQNGQNQEGANTCNCMIM